MAKGRGQAALYLYCLKKSDFMAVQKQHQGKGPEKETMKLSYSFKAKDCEDQRDDGTIGRRLQRETLSGSKR